MTSLALPATLPGQPHAVAHVERAVGATHGVGDEVDRPVEAAGAGEQTGGGHASIGRGRISHVSR